MAECTAQAIGQDPAFKPLGGTLATESNLVSLDVGFPINEYPVIPEGYRWVRARVGGPGGKGFMCLSLSDMRKIVERSGGLVVEWFAGPIKRL